MRKLGIPAATILQGLEPRGSGDSKVGKSLRVAAVLGGIVAVLGMLAICLLALSSLMSKAFASRDPRVPIVSSMPEQLRSLNDRALETGIPEPSQPLTSSSPIDHLTVRNDSKAPREASAASPEATTPIPKALPIQPPVSDVPPSADKSLGEQQPVIEKSLSEHVRRNLERQRRHAENKRSRLEQMYQEHSISKDEYRKGEEEYQRQIQKYREGLGGQ